jgi:peptide/nickel transport system substrate-binding protein
MKRWSILLVAAMALVGSAAAAQTLRVGLREDPDILDPTLARTFVGRIVFASLCDKLFDIDENLRIVPQLATEFAWGEDNRTLTIRLREGVVFHDGERMDAEAVKFSLERHLTMQGSFRRSEINTMESVEVVDPLTVRIRLSAPFAPFISQITDRAGMIVSPKAAREAGPNFGNRPVCAGPFRFVERVAQDRITVERFPQYWDAARIHLERVEYRIIYDSTVRLANLQSGAIEMGEITNPTDLPAVRRNPRLRVTSVAELGYQSLTVNIGNGERARTPLGQDARIREALELAIDRATINQVVYAGEYTVGNQWVPPGTPFYAQSLAIPQRDVARARALLREAGQPNPVINLTVPNSPDLRQVAEVIQAMAREAGFDIRLQAMEFAASLTAAQRGDFEAYLLGWSGRVDPDGNLASFATCRGAQNDGRYCNAEVDRLIEEARAVNNPAQRRALYERIGRILLAERPRIYLWHRKNIIAHVANLQGFRPVADGLIRLQDVRLAAN